MKRKDYRKPMMKVVQLQHQCHILAGSGVEANRSSYGTAVEETWGDDASGAKAIWNTNVWDDDWSNQ